MSKHWNQVYYLFAHVLLMNNNLLPHYDNTHKL